MKIQSLPLGIDIGTTRMRVVGAIRERNGVRITAVATRDISTGSASSGVIAEPEYVAALVEEAVTELGARQRNCVIALAHPDAALHAIRLPKMRHDERLRAAAFEAKRFIDYPIDEATIRLRRMEDNPDVHIIGIARTAVMSSRLSALRRGGLKPVAVDVEACALLRQFPGYDAVIDIGYDRVSMHVARKDAAPTTLTTASGGVEVTESIAQELAIDRYSAEKRKRILGTAGAGNRARRMLASQIIGMLESPRNRASAFRRLAFTGNGARLPGLLADIELSTGACCELPVGDSLQNSEYPDDVIRAAAPDWTLAASLATWAA